MGGAWAGFFVFVTLGKRGTLGQSRLTEGRQPRRSRRSLYGILSARILVSVLIAGIAVLNASGSVQAALDDSQRLHPGAKAPTKGKMKQAWAWRAQQSEDPSLKDLSGIPDEDVVVAWFGERDKLTYLDIGGPSLKGATLALKIDEEGLNVAPEDAELQACLILQRWKPQKPMAWNQKPTTDCESVAPGKYERSSQTFVFDLTPLARGLSSSTVHGLSIEPVDEPESHFQVVFKGGRSVVVQVRAGDESDFELPEASSGSGSDMGGRNDPVPFAESDDSLSFQSEEPGFLLEEPLPQSEEPPPQSDAADPIAIDGAPAVSETKPVTFTWVYAALVTVAVFPLITRLLAYSLPKGTGKRKKR